MIAGQFIAEKINIDCRHELTLAGSSSWTKCIDIFAAKF
jgi:hypothetical protein